MRSRKNFGEITSTDFTYCNAQYSIAEGLASKLTLYLPLLFYYLTFNMLNVFTHIFPL